ncbi:unnamed protein product [Soboliphyme baturini]|uniref:acetate--CoA ligase n=1 Tax=Soboliphyme baturini TaxID=241478 RepID=A0A183J561_9BILA|nr:unnamed protein product [Soboliphyme baturini]
MFCFSGSTGKPKGVVHTQLGYLLYAYATFRYVFDYHDRDVHFCTADLGWITGHTYVLYGPLANGCTCVLFEGIPTHPNPDRYWSIIDKYKVTKFYTAPTAIRHLMRYGDHWVNSHRMDSLQILGSVGETFNPEAWLWYYKVVGRGRCSIVDTYWQTETGGHVVTPLPGCMEMKPGAVGFPFFGIKVALLTDDGKEIEGVGEGYLVLKAPWPGMMRTLYQNQQAFEDTYFTTFPGCFTCGDGGKRDKDGFLWITGRVDDMMNVSGHLVSNAEIESAVVAHPGVAEAAVVAAPHSIKGQIPYCFVILKNGYSFTDELVREIKNEVRSKIGPVAVPEVFQRAEGLPKTRSGKIMRRVLRKIAVGETEYFGDLSTLAEEHVIHDLVHDRSNIKID